MTKFLLLSDIHASDIDPSSSNAPSYVSSFNAAASAKKDPITDLERILNSPELKPDYILCAGDITNKSQPSGLSYAWNRLNSLADALGAELVATVGNHDLDSRFSSNRFDPRGYVMSLRPALPVADRTAFLEYWAEHFTVLRKEDCTLLVVNTASYHGGGADPKVELEHGRVSEVTNEAIAARLAELSLGHVNVALCHHHPIRAEPSDKEFVGLTRGGERLMSVLAATGAPWVLVHGHKHRPELFYGDGGGNAPVVLSCASFSAQVNADAQNKNPNQVHLLVCDRDDAAVTAYASAGQVLSWTWQDSVGWSPARGAHGLPHVSGFGFRGPPRSLVEAIEAQLDAHQASSMAWREMVQAVPALDRVLPMDFEQIESLASQRGINILRDRDEKRQQVGRQQ